MQDTWHTLELKNHLKLNWQDSLSDSTTVFLSNPEKRKELDRIIIDCFYPALKRATKNSPVKLTSGKDLELQKCIEEEWRVHTTKSLTFLLEDPERPLVPYSNIRWFCRGKIECSAENYMIHFDFYIYFPETISMINIVSLLKDPAFSGMPPQLSFQNLEDDYGEFCLEYSKGVGKGWGLSEIHAAENHTILEVGKNHWNNPRVK